MTTRLEKIKNAWAGGYWSGITEVPKQGIDLVKENPWKTAGIVGVLALASALFVHYYKYPDSKYAGFINNVAGVTSSFVKANPTIILAACLAIAVIAIGVLAYKNNDKANKIEAVMDILNDVNRLPDSKVNEIKPILEGKSRNANNI
ncbi:MAG: hypothetical protein PG981_001038 [Wolbachia endosymbiont of Ctenocephalides orientis wCori]|nr:MAG: hypothetical protein PG981_001038 [Wolbachia endosymbiont of Ctenocephalides orientis wCori]